VRNGKFHVDTRPISLNVITRDPRTWFYWDHSHSNRYHHSNTKWAAYGLKEEITNVRNRKFHVDTRRISRGPDFRTFFIITRDPRTWFFWDHSHSNRYCHSNNKWAEYRPKDEITNVRNRKFHVDTRQISRGPDFRTFFIITRDPRTLFFWDHSHSSRYCHSNNKWAEYRPKDEITNVRNGKFHVVTRRISRGPDFRTFFIITRDPRTWFFWDHSHSNRYCHSNNKWAEYGLKKEIGNVRNGKFH
jgi:hypothetical protein